MNRWHDTLARVDALSLKERLLVLVATLLVIGYLWQGLLMAPLDREERAARQALQASQEEIATLQSETHALITAAGVDPDATARGRLTALRADLEQRRGAIDARLGDLVAPDQMAALLKSVLVGSSGMRLIGLESLPPEPLLPPAPVANAAGRPAPATPSSAASPAPGADADGISAWRHGMRLVVEGSYLDTLAYLDHLESLGWSFFWDSLDLEVSAHPMTTTTVTVVTLGLDRTWLAL